MQVPCWYERDVSRETLEKLAAYCELIQKWTTRINLVARSTQDEIATRHIWDSAQIYQPWRGCWLDFGSGGGLPGLVISILGQGERCDGTVSLIESDQRKAVFLRTCARELDLSVNVISARIENTVNQNASVVSARALTHMDSLLAFAQQHTTESGICVFMKGAQWYKEVLQAQQSWRFSYDATPSKTDPNAAILTVKDIERV